MRRMTSSRFFRLVRRFNSLIPLAAVVITVLAVLVALLGSAWDYAARRRASRTAPVADESGDDRLELQSPSAILGTPVTVLALIGTQELGGFSSGSAERTCNLLFHDVGTGKMHWLRPKDDAAILAWEVLREGEVAEDYGESTGVGARGKGSVLGIRYELAEADTDGDGVVGGGDRLQVALSGVNGEGLTTVLRDADEIRGYSAPHDGRLAVFFRRGEEERVAELDLEARKLVREARLPGMSGGAKGR
jgi:hypothetical protein